ncbi:MAG TPA: TPD domain-containing protein [Candidatus Methanofastidiosum sp.]|nr:TPD domain-containing protein [Methanofastidiosum sp.]
MRKQVFMEIYKSINTRADVPELSCKYEIGEDVLLSILSQKTVRNVKKDYYPIMNRIRELTKLWDRGLSFFDIASKLSFSPILIATMILKEKGFNKKDIKDIMHNPDSIEDERIKNELIKAIEVDIAYSPQSSKIQRENGKNGEEMLKVYLDKKEIQFLREDDLRKLGSGKTPDFLLKKPIKIRGRKVFWFESKASFCDYIEFKQDYNKQLKHYISLFGPGIVVYWKGYIDDIVTDKRVLVVDTDFFENIFTSFEYL